MNIVKATGISNRAGKLTGLRPWTSRYVPWALPKSMILFVRLGDQILSFSLHIDRVHHLRPSALCIQRLNHQSLVGAHRQIDHGIQGCSIRMKDFLEIYPDLDLGNWIITRGHGHQMYWVCKGGVVCRAYDTKRECWHCQKCLGLVDGEIIPHYSASVVDGRST